jgi:YebC/PmpR family DNA-binding regulatory protein
MPKDNIERAIKRGTGELGGEIIEEITYEGYGSGGVAILVDVVTDNRNRTQTELRKIFERGGGKMASAGAVAYQFDRKGLLSVNTSDTDEDTLMSIALDAGAEDMKQAGSTFDITCDPAAFNQVQDALTKAGLKPVVAEVTQLPKVPMDVDAETARKVLRMMEALDDHDDVQNVYSNIHLTEELAAQVAEG